MSEINIDESHTPLLVGDSEAVDGHADYQGCPLRRSESGGRRSASFVSEKHIYYCGIALERFTYHGIESNLINYLTGALGESMAAAAANVHTWVGIGSLVAVLGAFLADSFLDRYRSIIITSILYILGLAFLTLSATITPRFTSTEQNSSGPDTRVQIIFFISLYLVALAQGYSPCLQAFAADEFAKGTAKSSFFNWRVFCGCIGGIAAHLILKYILDYINWGISFGILCLAMIIGLVLFLCGKRIYHFPAGRGDDESPCRRIISKATVSCSDIVAPSSGESSNDHEKTIVDSRRPIKIWNLLPRVLRLLPTWITCLSCTIVRSQSSTLFTKQAKTVDKSIWQGFEIPAAAIQIFIPVTLMLWIAIYDLIFVPITRCITKDPSGITKHPSGITMLQRIGIGMAAFVLDMVIAALVEKKRLETAHELGLLDTPNATVPMSFWWLVPQYMLQALARAFTDAGMQEFFYDQVPIELRSFGLSFYHGALGIGNFLSSFLVFVIDKATSQNGNESWISDNLNRAHIDYFYWLLAGIGAVGLILFVYLAKSYIYSEQNDLKRVPKHK